MSTQQVTTHEPAEASATLEILWDQDVGATVLHRAADGSITSGGLELGLPAVVTLDDLGPGASARRVSLDELLALADDLPGEPPLGATARTVLATIALAHRSVTEGLVHPHLEFGGGRWNALWGATLDEHVQGMLAALARAMPPVGARAFGGDREEAVYDLYGCAVDRIARNRLVAAGVTLGAGTLLGGPRTAAIANVLDALAAPDSELPPHAGYAALEQRLAAWVDGGLANRSPAPWNVCLRLDERPPHPGEEASRVVLEVLLQAADDPTLVLPAGLLWDGGGDVFSFLRASDPRRALTSRLAAVEPVLADGGIVLGGVEPAETTLSDDAVRFLLRDAMPRLEELGVPVLLPGDWVSSPSRLRVSLTAASAPPHHSSGLFSGEALATFDWRLALGDATLTEAELAELAAAKEPLIRVGGRWHAVRRSDVDRALRFLEQRRTGGVVDLVRAVSGLETDEAGLELGEVHLDEALTELLEGADERQFAPLPTPDGMRHSLFPFQERGHGWLRLLGDMGIGAVLADDMGLGKTVQAIAMLVSEREEHGAHGPTLVVCPMSITRQWVKEIGRFAPHLRVHLHHGSARLTGDELVAAAGASDVVVTSYDIVARDVETLSAIAWDRLLLDEAQDAKNPATKRARALRRLRARRVLAMTGTPIENRLSELWAIMDVVNPGLLGPRERFERTFARPIELGGDERALARLRALVQPFVLRRPKDSPEVELDLPRISYSRVECHLTVEQASLYRATVDRWLPRVEAHEDRFGRRGAVLAMLGQLKQVCNHPELIVATGRPLDGRSGKLERLVELLGRVPEDDKALVFTQYPGFDRLAPHLAERTGRDVGFFHGGLAARRRDELVDSFSSPDGPSVLVISIKAGGRGLNLPAANHVFHFDRWWNPAVEQQATDRVYRFGQRKDVVVHSLVCTATLEERIDELLAAKRELAEKVIAARSDDWLGELDLDAIRAAVALSDDAVQDAA